MTDDVDQVDPAAMLVRQVATALLPELPAIGQGTANRIAATLPDLGRPATATLALSAT